MTALSGPARALDAATRSYFEPRLGASLGAVQVRPEARGLRGLGARAMTVGQTIAFAPGEYRPQTAQGRQLIAHELVHARQQAGGEGGAQRGAAEREAHGLSADLAAGRSVCVGLRAGVGPAFALTDYQTSMSDADMDAHIQALTVSQLRSDIAQINEFLDRQNASTEETVMLEHRRDLLAARLQGLVKAANTDPPKPKGGKKAAPGKGKNRSEAPNAPPTEADAPRILREQTSMDTSDPEEVKQEVDRIVAWLQRSDVSKSDRQILRMELQTLSPKFENVQAQESSNRQAERLRASFGNTGEGAEGLKTGIRKIEGIFTDPAEPGVAFLPDGNERVRISTEQAAGLRKSAADNMSDALRKAKSKAESAWGLYDLQSGVNDDHPVVAAISGWLGGVDDPKAAMQAAQARLTMMQVAAEGMLKAGNLSGAVDPLVAATNEARRIHVAVYAWQNGLISGAETAVTGLTFIRDCSAAIAISIGAVLAAPLVAGAVGAGGLGLTGAAATGTTILGTGAVVGSGAGTVFGAAEYGGQRLAGANHEDAMAAANTVAKQRFIEGGAAGMGGATSRVISTALGPGSTAVTRFGVNAVAQGGGNFVGGTSASLMQGDDIDVAFGKGAHGAGVGILTAGAASPFKTPVLQTGASMVVGTGLGYADARWQGATHEEAMRSGAINLATGLAISSSPNIQKQQAQMEARGQRFGSSVRNTAVNTTRAAMVGLALSGPAFQGSNSSGQTFRQTPAYYEGRNGQANAAQQQAPPPSNEQQQQQAPIRRESRGAMQGARPSSTALSAMQEQVAMGFLDPALVAPGARVATATAGTARSITTGVRAQTAEVSSYDKRLSQGQVGIVAPIGSNVPGLDYAVGVQLPNGDWEIQICDTKSKVSATSRFGQVDKTTLKPTWRQAVDDGLQPGRLDLGDPAMEQGLRDAWNAGRVRIVRDTVDYSSGTGGEPQLDN